MSDNETKPAEPDMRPFSQLTGELLDLPANPGIREGDQIVDKVYPVYEEQEVRCANGEVRKVKMPKWVDGELVTETLPRPLAVQTHVAEPVGLVDVNLLSVDADESGGTDVEESGGTGSKTKCEHCGKSFKNLQAHLKNCKSAPSLT